MATERMRLGREGEQVACDYLEGLGHRVLRRNWRVRHLEVDIVSLASDGVHFVEVKSRVAPLMAPPQDSVTSAKRRNLAAAAGAYLRGQAQQDGVPANAELFFDVVAVTFEGGSTTVEYFPKAFIPIYF